MRHNVKKVQLNKPRDQRRLLLKNLATSLILNEKIKTTQAKAKALQPLIDKIIIISKKEDKMSAIRELNSFIQGNKKKTKDQLVSGNEIAAKKLIETIGTRYKDRQSGFTRITKLGFRSGDAAPLVQIELV